MAASDILLILLLLLSAREPQAVKHQLPSNGWPDWHQVLRVYTRELSIIDSLSSRNRLRLHPETRVLNGTMIVAACHLAVEVNAGRWLKSVKLWHRSAGGVSHFEVTATTPKRSMTSKEARDPTNYNQEFQCAGQLCNATAGGISSEGVGVFQFPAVESLAGSFGCSGVTDGSSLSGQQASGLSSQELSTGIVPFSVYLKGIGSPAWDLPSDGVAQFVLNRTMNATCRIENSSPASDFELQLLLDRPGTGGLDLLRYAHVNSTQAEAQLNWIGERATLSVSGSGLLCRAHRAWGGVRQLRAKLMVKYMLPAYITSSSIERSRIGGPNSARSRVPASPSRIKLFKGEFAICLAQGMPQPLVNWTVLSDDESMRSSSGALFVTRRATSGRVYTAQCVAQQKELSLQSVVSVLIEISATRCSVSLAVSTLCCSLACLVALR